MSDLDSRLAKRLQDSRILADSASPFDESATALEKFTNFKEYGLAAVSVDSGFAEGATEPEYGEMKEREQIEFRAKQKCWKTIRTSGGDGVWTCLAYRHNLHSFDNPPFWNLFNGLLFSNSTATAFLIIDYHESDKLTRPIPITERNSRSQIKANELYEMLLLCDDNIQYVASSWIGPTTPLDPKFLPSLPAKSSTSLPSSAMAIKLPSAISIITKSNYQKTFKSDDISDIKTALVINLGFDEAEEYAGEDRFALVLKPGCENCGDETAKLRCGGCKGPSYCSLPCQKLQWKGHKKVCKRQQELFHQEGEGEELGSKKEHVHEAGCSHSHKH